MKIDTQALDEMVRKISAVIPDDLKSARQSLEKNARIATESVFQRLDLVTREEFDVQEKMLSNSQLRVKKLEQRIQELENKILDK
ncbi:MAG: accessory factor UbiK family protein [Gammaproteobacteria bacterium]|nr:accessory factor UbiK family protein [Gammaproteobacteria bacterium]